MASKHYKITGIKGNTARQFCGSFSKLAAARMQIKSKARQGWTDFVIVTVMNGREVSKEVII